MNVDQRLNFMNGGNPESYKESLRGLGAGKPRGKDSTKARSFKPTFAMLPYAQKNNRVALLRPTMVRSDLLCFQLARASNTGPQREDNICNGGFCPVTPFIPTRKSETRCH